MAGFDTNSAIQAALQHKRGQQPIAPSAPNAPPALPAPQTPDVQSMIQAAVKAKGVTPPVGLQTPAKPPVTSLIQAASFSPQFQKQLQETGPLGQLQRTGEHSAIEKFNGLMDMGMVAIDSLLVGGEEGQRARSMLGQGLKDFAHLQILKGANEVTDASMLYGPGAAHLNQALAQEGGIRGEIGQFMIDHPTINATTAFVAEMFNPETWAFGLGAGKVIGLGGKAAQVLPKVFRFSDGTVATIAKVPRTFQHFFNNFAILHHARGEEGEAWGNKWLTRLNLVGGYVDRKMMEIFGPDLSPEEQRMVVRLSQKLKSPYANKREARRAIDEGILPADFEKNAVGLKALIDSSASPRIGDLYQRAVKLRTFIKATDRLQKMRGLLDKERTFDSDLYFPMPRSERVTQLAEAERNASELPETQMFTNGSGFRTSAGTAARGSHKAYQTLEEREALSPGSIPLDWSPADSFRNWATGGLRNVQVENALSDLDQLGLRIPKHYWHQDNDGNILDFGHGEEGYKKAQEYARRNGSFFARVDTLQKLGLKRPPRTEGASSAKRLANQSLRYVQSTKTIVAQQARGTAKDIGTGLQGGLTTQAVSVLTRGARSSLRYTEKTLAAARAHAANLIDRYVNATFDEALRKQYLKEYHRLQSRKTAEIEDAIGLSSRERTLEESGFRSYEYNPQVHAPSLEHTAIHPDVFAFLKEAGAPQEHANAIASWIDTLNKWARIGIIANPAVHVLWNLAHNFLAAGGDIRFLGAGVWKEPERRWLNKALHDGAIVTMRSGRSMLQSRGLGRVLTTHPDHLTAPEKLDRALTLGWQQNQHVVFDLAEARMATHLYKRYVTELGMSGPVAARAVRKALGDYMNITPTERAAKLNRVFFFYPWMKTVVPFWTYKGLTKPQYITAPAGGIGRYNQAFGYNTGGQQRETNPFAIHVGGEENAYLPLLPERYFGIAASAVLGDSTQQGPIYNHIARGAYTLLGHLNPLLAGAFSSVLTLVPDPALPGEKPFVMFDKRQSATYEARDLTTNLIGNTLATTAGGMAAAWLNTALPAGLFGGVRPFIAGGLGSAASKLAGNFMGGSGSLQATPIKPSSLLTVFPGGYVKKETDKRYYAASKRAEQELTALHGIAQKTQNARLQHQVDTLLDALRSGDETVLFRASAMASLLYQQYRGL